MFSGIYRTKSVSDTAAAVARLVLLSLYALTVISPLSINVHMNVGRLLVAAATTHPSAHCTLLRRRQLFHEKSIIVSHHESLPRTETRLFDEKRTPPATRSRHFFFSMPCGGSGDWIFLPSSSAHNFSREPYPGQQIHSIAAHLGYIE